MKKTLLTTLLICVISLISFAQEVTLKSPNGQILVKIQISKEDVRYSVQMGDETILAPSAIAMTLQNGTVLGKNPKLMGGKKRSVKQDVTAFFLQEKRH